MINWRSLTIPIIALLFVFAHPHRQQTITFNLYSTRIFLPEENVVVRFDGLNIREPVKLRLFEVTDPVSFFATRDGARAPMMLDAMSTPQESWEILIKGFPVVRDWEEAIRRGPNEWISTEIALGTAKSGVYIIEARAHGKRAYTTAIISPYALITKQTRSQLLVYLLDRKKGTLVSNADVIVYRKKEKLAEGKTNPQGLFFTALPPPLRDNGEPGPILDVIRPFPSYHQQTLVMARRGKDFIIADPQWYSYGRESDFMIYTFSERPVYRPAQEVFFKGIIRKKGERATLSAVVDQLVRVTVRDARGSEVMYDSMRTNSNGTFHGRLTLLEGAALGTYTLQTSIEGASEITTFEVQEYKKPEYEVTLLLDNDRYAKGQKIRGVVKAIYYFGSPVANANVEYAVYRSRYWRPWWIGTDYEWFYEGRPEIYANDQQMVYTGFGQTDANGQLAIAIETDKEATLDYTYRIDASVTDASRRSISGSASVEVTRGLFAMTLQTDQYVYRAGDDARIALMLLDFQNKGVAAPYVATISRDWWDRIPRIQNGQTLYDFKHRVEPITAITGTTDFNGRGTVNFPVLEPGTYVVSISANDSLGNTITENSYIYGTAKDHAGYVDMNRGTQIIPDRERYTMGDTLRVLVLMPEPGLDVLVTSEADRLIDYRVVRFSNQSMVVDVPITEAHAGNFFLSVSSLRGEQLFQTTKSILVFPKNRFLSVDIISGKEFFKPGEETSLLLKVRDSKGNPVRNAELSLGVVDESIYAIATEMAPDIRKFFYGNRLNSTQTWSSIYFSFFGYAQTDVDALNGRRVRMGAPSTAMEMTKSSETTAPGEAKKPRFVEAILRKDFRDLMHWSPVVATDDKGIVRVKVKIPDNLTTWRATVRAVTPDTKVGSSTLKVIVRKNLLVRTEIPRFLTQRDTTTIATIVHNYLGEDKTARVSLTASGATVLGKEKTLRVPRNGFVRVDWRLATSKAGTAVLKAQALTDEESDAMEAIIPILPHGLEVAQAQVIDLQHAKDGKSILLTIPNEADLATAKVVVHLSPSLASSILTALDDLVGYPYGCVEQTMSRFLPTIVVANAFQDLGAPLKADVQQELPKMVESGLKRLYSLQHQDGGWGWWENDNTDAFMTSYVVYGMTLARTANYSVTDNVLSRGIGRVESLLASSDKIDPTTRAYAMYVLAFAASAGVPVDKQLVRQQIASLDLRGVNNYTRSLIALASFYSGDKAAANSMAQTLEQNATQTGTAAFWSGKAWHYNWQDDNVETTAFALKALLASRGDSKLVQQAVHWLLAQKRGGSWLSTKQTAIVIFALVDYLKQSKELQPNYTATLTMNGASVSTQRMTKEMLFDKEPTIEVSGGLLKKGINTLRVEKDGIGRLYCTARVRYYSQEENIDAGAAGFSLKRDYYKLVRIKRGNEYVYIKEPFRGVAAPGDELFVNITLSSDGNYEYFMLEDPLPPGVEVQKDERNYKIDGEQNYQYDPWYVGWRYWWVSKEVRDEKVAFFARNIGAGTYLFSYIVRAQIPGRYHVMPSTGSLMYYPEVRGNSNEMELVIKE